MESSSILAVSTCSCGQLTISGGRHHLGGKSRQDNSKGLIERSTFGLDPPATTFTKLQRRANALLGATVGELAELLGADVPLSFMQDKGFVGNLVQEYFGYPPNSTPSPDLGEFGIEVKTFATSEFIDAEAKPSKNVKDNVKLYSFGAQSLIGERRWSSSRAYKKLRCILLVPYVRPIADWTRVAVRKEIERFYFRVPVIWMPSDEQGKQLEDDWNQVRSWYSSGGAAGNGSPGSYLYADTAGLRGQETYSSKGTTYSVRRRAFYIKKELISRLVIENCLLSESQ